MEEYAGTVGIRIILTKEVKREPNERGPRCGRPR
jgi:hypothetical protein